MNALQNLFSQGQTCFANRQFKQAYQYFYQCTQIIPEISAPWENMAVCLANQGLNLEDIEHQLCSMAPTPVHADIQQKLKTLSPLQKQIPAYLTLLQQLEVSKATQAFEVEWQHNQITEDDAIQFLRALFIAHEHLAKKHGQMHLPKLLNQWKDLPAIQYCMDITSQRVQTLIQRHSPATALEPHEIELLETLGLVHYTYTNYAEAAMCFQVLLSLSTDPDQRTEYQTHLSTCYSLNAQYAKALQVDENNTTAWERHDPTNPRAFRAQALRMIRSAQQIHRHCLAYWPAHLVHHQDAEIVIARIEHATVCGHDPMVFDSDFVYAGNRGTFRLARPNQDKEVDCTQGIVLFATNPNNHYHLLIEFCSKLLAVEHLQYDAPIIPKDIPIYIPTSNLTRVQEMVNLLGIERTILDFSVHENLHFEELYVIDVSHAGHFSTQPANLWDCYLPQAASIQRLISQFKQNLEGSTGPKNLFIYAKRGGGARSFDDPDNLIEDHLHSWASQHNLELVIFEGNTPLLEQIQLFQRCHTLFGIHGAGLTNILFTDMCYVVEIPIHGNCNPLFQEISEITRDHHIVCSVTCEYQGSITVTSDILTSITAALNQTVAPSRDISEPFQA